MAPRAGPRAVPDAAASMPSESDALWDELRDCHRRLRTELAVVVRRHGIHLSEYRALGRLREGPRTPSQLAERLGLTPASVTDLANQLLGRGWVERQPHPKDRRAYLLRATAAGFRAHAAARREYRTRLAEVYAAVSPDARSALAGGLRELSRVLEGRSVRSGNRPGTDAGAAGGPPPL